MTPQVAIALVTGIAASAEDLWHRQISNWIPAAALAAGLCAMSVDRGWRGALSSVLGAAGGFLVFLVFYWLGGMGGGDVKLMAGFGAVLGVERLLEAALWTAGCGGVIAAVCVAVSTVRNLWANRPANAPVKAIPYAPAIAIGSWLALVTKA